MKINLFERNEKKVLIIVFALFAIIQIILVTLLDVEQFSDSLSYLKNAYSAIDAGKIYPLEHNLNDRWIAAPGWVNLIALFLVVFGSIKSVLYLNIVLNLIILAELYYIVQRFLGSKSAIITLLLFVLLLSNYGIVLFLYTELIFMALLLGSVCFFVQGRLHYTILSGILIGLANWIRPFAPVVFVLLFISLLILKLPLKRMIPWTLSLSFIILIIGGITYFSSGQFISSSITTGANMIAGSNPLSDGSYDGAGLRKGGIGYIPDESLLNVKEKDAIWKERAVKWAVENPGEWLKLIPKKLFYLYSCEISTLHHFRSESRTGSYAEDFKALINHFPQLTLFDWLLVLNNLVYLFILIMSFISIYFVFLNRFYPGYITLLYIFLMTGTTVLAVGADRYHYPMMPAMILMASYCLENLYSLLARRPQAKSQVPIIRRTRT